MKNKMLSKQTLLIASIVAFIGIIVYVLSVFSFDSIEEINYNKHYYLIAPIFLIGILSSGLYSILYFNNTIKYDLSFGITRKESFKSYLKTIGVLLGLLVVFSIVYFCTIIIYLLFKHLTFKNVINFIIKLINEETFLDLICYYILFNGLFGFISNKLENKQISIIIVFVSVIILLFIFNIFFNILNGHIIYNIVILIIGILGFIVNYKYTIKKNF